MYKGNELLVILYECQSNMFLKIFRILFGIV